MAAVIGRKVGIRPKRADDWTVVANLWGMIVGRPGVLKTPAAEEAIAQLKRLVAEAIERYEQEIRRHEEEKLIAAARREAAKEELKKEAKKKEPSEERLRELAAEARADDEADGPLLRRYIVNDSTVEKLGELLRDNPNGFLIFRDELSGLLRSMDKQGHETDRSFYLEGWNGTGAFESDRIGRGNVRIKAVCFSILGGIQPGPLAAYLRSALSASGDDGFVSRFQLAVYPDQDRPFQVVDREPDVGAKNRAYRLFKALDHLKAEDVGACQDDDRRSIPYLRFAADAQEFFYQWWERLESKVKAEDVPALESHLAKYRSLMPSLALLFHLADAVPVEEGESIGGGPVSLDAARRAAAWCDFLEHHARRIYGMAIEGDIQPAVTLTGRLAKLPDPFTARDVLRKGWVGLSTLEDVERTLGILEDHNWVRSVEERPTGERGRPRAARYYLHPEIRGEARP
jgi:putative DNA primase/helicase